MGRDHSSSVADSRMFMIRFWQCSTFSASSTIARQCEKLRSLGRYDRPTERHDAGRKIVLYSMARRAKLPVSCSRGSFMRRRRSKGTCSNVASIGRHEIEARILGGLKDRLMAPDLVREFVEAFQKETNRVAAEREQAEELATARLGAIARKIAALVSAIENGKYSPALSSRLAALENEKADLLVEMAQGPAPSIVRLHPAIADVYAAKVARQMSSCVRSSNESNLVLVKKDSQCGPCLLATSRGSLLSAKQPQKTRTAPRRRPGAVPVDGGCGDRI